MSSERGSGGQERWLIDRFGRKITNLRISLTHRCNLRCIYCHHEGERSCTVKMAKELAPAEIEEIMKVACSFGVRKVKFTGGEPTLREDLCEIVGAVPEGVESSMTTNGTLLADCAYELKDAGLSRVNVSLDTLDPILYRRITGVNALDSVLSGIEAGLDAGLKPVKLNMVILKDLNENEVDSFLSFVSRRNGLILQIIELMESDECRFHTDISELERNLASKADRFFMRSMHHRKKYHLDGVEVEVVRPLHNTEFCAYCNRLRVTSSGELKPCLLREDNHIDIRGVKGKELEVRFLEAVSRREPFFK
ncbi:MAG: GTP 3',8-cyclase MoaA [Methanomicrobiales archaeon]|nr:GTP 3',8-cyclase MoaA [Methanomicrobiales archaeon]